MTILNYILHNLFVGVQKTSTQYSFALRQPLGGRASLACAYANIASQRNFTHEGHNFLTICADRLQLFTLLSNQGGVFINEIRTNFGLRPDPELDGVRCQSLNFVNANKADEYQGVADTQQTGEVKDV